jgi:hypothetical protein
MTEGNGSSADLAALQALNVAILEDARAVADEIRPEWLTHSRQLILKAAIAAQAEGWQPNGFAVQAWLAERGDVTLMTRQDLSRALDYPGSKKDLALYARILERAWRARRADHLAVEIAGEADLGRRAELGAELAATSVPRVELGPENSDAGNADRLVAAAAGKLRHCQELGEGERGWLWWNGNHWERRAAEHAYRLLEALLRDGLAHVSASDKSGAKWFHGSLAEPRLRAAIRLAQMAEGMRVPASDLDAKPWLLNCANGTLELDSSKLREPKREDWITIRRARRSS